jgi:alpha/beta superfamily hydrolase
MPTLRRRWEEYRPSKTEAFWTAAGCVAATLVIGFGFGGWVTGGTAQKRVDEASAQARHELAAAICVEEFMAAKDARARLATLKKAEWYQRDKIVAADGWATMPDREEPNMLVAEMCAAKLAEMPAAKEQKL